MTRRRGDLGNSGNIQHKLWSILDEGQGGQRKIGESLDSSACASVPSQFDGEIRINTPCKEFSTCYYCAEEQTFTTMDAFRNDFPNELGEASAIELVF